MSRRVHKQTKAGVTILEVVVAIFVIMTGLISALALIFSSILGARFSKNEFIAANLGREAIEVVRQIRDSNWLEIEAGVLDSGEWDKDLYKADGSIYSAILNFNDDNASPDYMKWTPIFDQDYLDDIEQAKVYYRVNPNGLWVYNQFAVLDGSGDEVETQFRRRVTTFPICYLSNNPQTELIIDQNGLTCETLNPARIKIGLQVKVTLQWSESGKTRQVIQEDRLYNWK